MHIHVIPNRGSPPTVLLRESFREGAKVGKRTLANLSALSASQVNAMRALLRGEELRPVDSIFEIERSRPHGHVQAVSMAMKQLNIASLIGGASSRERDLVLAMVAARIVEPNTKLATTRQWHASTLAEDFGVADASEDDLYFAMDWLLERQDGIQKKLAKRHLGEGSLVLYDLSSSYFEGTTCPLAKRGHNRDGKSGKLQVNYGLLTDVRGCPVAVCVHPGNTCDSPTFMPEVKRLREDFGIQEMVMIGDRGMISKKTIAQMRDTDGIQWITALKSASIRVLVEQQHLQLGLFDDRNLVEIESPDYPGERLIACRNDSLVRLRAHKRESLLAATEDKLRLIQARVQAGKLKGQAKIGVTVGKVVNRHKVAKHFDLVIGEAAFSFTRKAAAIAAEAALDGLYIIRTSVPEDAMDGPDCVRYYKALANVERAFRSIKTVDLNVRPIHHRLESRVRAHIFLCMLAYYVEWHIKEVWREITFADTELDLKLTRDPVAPAQRSESAKLKAKTKLLSDGTPAHSFSSLMTDLSTIVRNTCRTPGADTGAPNFEVLTTPTAAQTRALDLIRSIHV